MKTTRRWSLPLLLLFVGCTAPDELPRFTAVADVQQLMVTLIEPAADVYWDAVGWILDETGTTEIRPGSDEEWDLVRNAAYVLAESGNLLMMEGRGVEAPAWVPMAQAMITVGQRAIEAAESRNEAAVFDVGAEVYYVCSNCHRAFAIETLSPSEVPGN